MKTLNKILDFMVEDRNQPFVIIGFLILGFIFGQIFL